MLLHILFSLKLNIIPDDYIIFKSQHECLSLPFLPYDSSEIISIQPKIEDFPTNLSEIIKEHNLLERFRKIICKDSSNSRLLCE